MEGWRSRRSWSKGQRAWKRRRPETEAEGEGAPETQEATSAGAKGKGKGKGKGTGGSIFGGGRGDAGKRDAQRRHLEKLRQLLPPGLDRNAAEAGGGGGGAAESRAEAE